MRILTVVATCFGLAALVPGAVLAAETQAVITVTGEGHVNAVPDLATISIGVTTAAATAKEALDANSAQLVAAIGRLKAAGIEDRDMQTSGLSLSPQVDYDRKASDGSDLITGFIATNNVTVQVRAIAGLGDVLDAVVTDGANTLGGVSFGLQDPGPKLDEARKDAVADARHKAELYAGAAGVKLGPIVSITDQAGFTNPMPMQLAERAFKDVSVPVAAGEVGVTANVVIVWALTE